MLRVIIFIFIMVSVSSRSLAQDYRYAIFDIPWSGGGFSSANGVAVDGMVVAGSNEPNAARIVLWRNGEFLEQLGLGGSSAINDRHDVVGSTFSIATLWRNDGQVIELGTLGGDQSSANDINNLGQIVGVAELAEGHPHGSHAFLWENGEMRDLGSPGRISWANAINNRSQIAGKFTSEDFTNSTGAFFWENGKFTVLPRLTDRPAVANAINDDGVVVGVAAVPIFTHAAKWIDGEIFDIHDDLAASSSSALTINNLGVIGGNMFSRAEDRVVGFITENGRMINLNDHLPPRRRYDISWVNDLNDFGQIAGRDVDRGRGVILSPVTPTLALSGPDPGVPGQSSRLTVTNATPGSRVYFVYGAVGGGTAIPGCDLQTGAALQINSPTLAGMATANANGIASITRFIPSAAQGRIFLIQAVQKNGCKVSQLVVHRFE